MPIADSYRVTERVLEGGDMWSTVEGLRGAGESYLGLFFISFLSLKLIQVTFGMSKRLRITWLFVALFLIVIWNTSKVGQNH